MHPILSALALLPAALVNSPVSPEPGFSAYVLNCVSAGGTAGTATVKTSANNMVLYAAPQASLVSISLAPNGSVFHLSLAIRDPATGEPAKVTMRPGEGRFVHGSRIMIETMGGTMGASVDYCLRIL